MLIGWVSDERYLALHGVAVEFQRDGETVAVATSTPRGAVLAELESGRYRVTLACRGYGGKSVEIEVPGDLPHSFRLLSDTLLGYAWPKWVCSGERSEFRVHSPEAYRLSLWRYGRDVEYVRLLGWFDEHGPRATVQWTPDADYTQTGVAWNRQGHGSPHHTQFAAAPERSGLYYFHAETESGASFTFPWVVAPAAPAAPLAVLAATNTWNAYNNFGGRSNYIHAAGLPPEPTVNARQDLLRYRSSDAYPEWQFPDEEYPPLSFDRPEPFNHIPIGTRVNDPIRGRQACHLAPAEWRLLGWLEREGFAYDLYAEEQLHSGVLDLDAYRALVVAVHPEYWTRRMYERVKSWVFERGGRLIYLAGNGLNCEVEYTEDGAMRCRTECLTVPDRPGTHARGEPGRRSESRFGRTVESEASLLGVVFTEAGIMTAAPYRVENPLHWAFRGTGLRRGDLFGRESLHERIPGGASGHETDKRSPSSPFNIELLAKGVNPDGGGGEVVSFTTPSGGAVFSVGSINWVHSLWVDAQLSRITANVLGRFVAMQEE